MWFDGNEHRGKAKNVTQISSSEKAQLMSVSCQKA